MQWFGDELRVIAAQAPYHAAVGARVLAIGSTPIRDVMERATQLVPRGENDGRTRLTATMQFTVARSPARFRCNCRSRERALCFRAGYGRARHHDALTGTVRRFFHLANGHRREATALSAAIDRSRGGQSFCPTAQTVYFSFTGYPPDAEFRERTAALARLLDESHARRLVIDLRRNQGGDFDQFRRLLLPIIKARAAINRKGGLFVITGPGTFSAATVNALDLRNEANAILVGAPTGMRPNHYGEHGEFRLPNSGFRISYSTQYHRFGADTDSAVVPDQNIEPTWAEFSAGTRSRDGVDSF